MYSYKGYLTTDTDIVDMNRELMVTSCGIYRLFKRQRMHTRRPNGRKDYQLLYIASGSARFTFGEETFDLTAGHMILYRPDIPQDYEYRRETLPEVCWVHFTGSRADELLNKIGFGQNNFLYCGTAFNFREIFRHMIRELQMKRPCFEELLDTCLRQLFTEIHRGCLETSSPRHKYSKEMEEIVHYFNESFSEDICIEECAKSRHMSVCWLIRSFRQYMGITPLQYITAIRINKAKELLKDTNYSIQEISNIVGYDNPLYFSRIFRKQTGCSPSRYRGC